MCTGGPRWGTRLWISPNRTGAGVTDLRGRGTMGGDDDERQASPSARQAGRAARCPAGAPPFGTARRPAVTTSSTSTTCVTGRKSAHPLVVIPGRPGRRVGRALPGVPRRAPRPTGLDVIMVEHRGVGMSRHDDEGADLPPEALTIDAVVDDVAAVLDDAAGRQGHRLRHVVRHLSGRRARRPPPDAGARHGPGLAAAVAPTTSTRCATPVRRVLWDGDGPGDRRPGGEGAPPRRRRRAAPPTDVAARRRHVRLARPGRARAANWTCCCSRPRLAVGRRRARRPGCCSSARRRTTTSPTWSERIGYRELNYGAVPDGKPLDPAVALREMATGDVEFVAEPYDLVAAMPGFGWPTVVHLRRSRPDHPAGGGAARSRR